MGWTEHEGTGRIPLLHSSQPFEPWGQEDEEPSPGLAPSRCQGKTFLGQGLPEAASRPMTREANGSKTYGDEVRRSARTSNRYP